MRFFSYLLCSFLLLSCTSGMNSPEKVLQSFAQKRFNKEITKENMGEFVDGKLLEELSSMSAEEFNSYNEIDDLRKKRFKITFKRCEKTKCFITYIISYDTVEGNEVKFNTETKKIAELVSTEKGWRISEITHLKTFHDSKESI